MRFSILSRYLFKDIVHYFFLFVLVFAVILVVNETFDTRSVFFENQPSLSDVAQFLVLSIPEKLAYFFPLVGLLGTMMAYGLLAKNREILAMIAAGVSFRRLAMPAFAFGVLLSIFAFWFNEMIAPRATFAAQYLEKVVIGGRRETLFSVRKDIFIKGIGNRFYYIPEYHSDTHTMVYPSIMEVSEEGGGIIDRIEARMARVVPGSPGNVRWELLDGEHWRFNPDGTLASYVQYDGPHQIDLEENLEKFLSETKDPEQMNFFELNEYAGMLDQRGGERTSQYSTPMYERLAFPFVCLTMTLLGFASVLDLHARRFTRGALTGIVVAIGYYTLQGIFISLGSDNHISPFFAAWAALIIFAGVVVYMFRRLEHLGH